MNRVRTLCYMCSFVMTITVVFVFCLQRNYVFVKPVGIQRIIEVFNGNKTKSTSFRYQAPDLRLIVITYNRASSLKRLLYSLNEALYFNDEIALDIWIDRMKNGSLDLDTLRVATEFKFNHGVTRVYNQSVNVGIAGQWITSWQPWRESKEIAVILEDDLTLSPYFYKYLKQVHTKYGGRRDVNGFSLQGVSVRHDGKPGYIQLPKENPVYLYPTLGTWGFSPNRANWFDFVDWYLKMRKVQSFKPLVPDHISSHWYRQLEVNNRQDSIWEMWHIHHAWKKNLLTLYPNCPDDRGFSFNWKENGLHYSGQSVKNKQEERLIREWNPKFDMLPDKPVILDNSGTIVQDQQMKTS